MRTLRVVIAILSAGFAFPLAAQVVGAGSGPLRVGLLAGLSSATFGGSDAEHADRLTAFLAGLYLVKPFAGGLAIRPEILFAKKGAEASFDDPDASGTFKTDVTYIDIPVLLQYEGMNASGVRPHLYAGPSLDFQINCSVEGSSGDVTLSLDCDEAGFDTESLEIAGIVGGGIGFPVGAIQATLGARYQHAFTDIASDAKIQNRVLSIYVSLEFGRR